MVTTSAIFQRFLRGQGQSVSIVKHGKPPLFGSGHVGVERHRNAVHHLIILNSPWSGIVEIAVERLDLLGRVGIAGVGDAEGWAGGLCDAAVIVPSAE